MKPEQLISSFLLINKSIQLEGIGILRLNKEITSTEDANNNIIFPEQSIYFEYNKNCKTDHSFIDFVSERTGKIKSLTSSDIESFMLISKQFLNIGKPFNLKDIGVIQKNQNGIYEFTQGEPIPEAIDTNHNKTPQNKDIDFSSPVKTKPYILPDKKIIAAGAVFLALIFALLIYFNHSKKIETIKNNNDSLSLIQNTKPSDSLSFINNTDSLKIIMYELNDSISAENIIKRINTNQSMKMIAIDSTHYQIIIAFKLPLKDSTYIKDSLERKFNTTMRIAN